MKHTHTHTYTSSNTHTHTFTHSHTQTRTFFRPRFVYISFYQKRFLNRLHTHTHHPPKSPRHPEIRLAFDGNLKVWIEFCTPPSSFQIFPDVFWTFSDFSIEGRTCYFQSIRLRMQQYKERRKCTCIEKIEDVCD